MKTIAGKLTVSSILVLLWLIPVIVLALIGPYLGQGHPDLVNQVAAYMRPPFNSQLDATVFSSEDVLHMQDVRSWMITVYSLLAIAAGCIVIIRVGTHQLFDNRIIRQIKQVFGVLLVLFGLGAILFVVNWQAAFVELHQVLFPTNQFWMLDPASSTLINMYPANVFQVLGIALSCLLGIEYVIISLVNKLHQQKHENTDR